MVAGDRQEKVRRTGASIARRVFPCEQDGIFMEPYAPGPKSGAWREVRCLIQPTGVNVRAHTEEMGHFL